MINTNRVVSIVAVVIALMAGLLPVIANLDWTSTAGVITSLGVLLGIVYKWLEGWQRYESQVSFITPQEIPADEGDPGLHPPTTHQTATS